MATERLTPYLPIRCFGITRVMAQVITTFAQAVRPLIVVRVAVRKQPPTSKAFPAQPGLLRTSARTNITENDLCESGRRRTRRPFCMAGLCVRRHFPLLFKAHPERRRRGGIARGRRNLGSELIRAVNTDTH